MTDEACDAYRNEHEERPTTDGVYLGRGRPLGLCRLFAGCRRGVEVFIAHDLRSYR